MEGGYKPWRREKVSQRGPVVSYTNLHVPMAAPPKHMMWVHDEDTREWTLQPKLVPKEDNNNNNNNDTDTTNVVVLMTHDIQPTDTFQGVCLRYKITPTALRQANGGFSGTNLHLAPNPLQIPTTELRKQQLAGLKTVTTKVVTKEHQIRQLVRSCTGLTGMEAKCYLELNDWNDKEALENAREDGF